MHSSDKFTISCADKKSSSKDLNRLTNIAAEYIIGKFNKKIVARIISDHFSHIEIIDIQGAIEFCTKYINDISKPMLRGYLKGPIIESQPCNIDGLINFRLQQYKLFLQSIMESVLYTYMEGKRYAELIQTVQYLVNITEIKNEYVHVVVRKDRILIYDNEMRRVQHEPLDPIFSALVSQGVEVITDTNIIINIILSAAPKYIILHSEGYNNKICGLIRDIWIDRVSSCNSICKLCDESDDNGNISIT